MSLMKHATKKIHNAGLSKNLEIHQYPTGYGLEDRRHSVQYCKLYDSADAVVQAALDGERPQKIPIVECPFCEYRFELDAEQADEIACPGCDRIQSIG